jgi:AAA domain, putative AbiEii toxin, Type IV TA system/AAA domain
VFQNFVVKNFRGFSSLLLQPLARVNLIAGKNNTGKTALLEAIRLHCDPSDSLLPTQINEGRGIDDPAKAFAELWAWFFFDRNPAHPAELSSQDDRGMTHTVKIQLTDIGTARSGSDGIPKPPDSFPGQGWHAQSPCLVLQYEGPGGEERTVWVIGARGEAWYTPRAAWHLPCELVGSGLPSADRDVRHFSGLETENRLGELLPSLQILEPRLRRLALAVQGEREQPVIHGDIGLSRLVPVALMGEGVRRLLSILLAIFRTPGGVVLVDEVENGLHYSVMREVWQAIARGTRQAGVQVFATTHSYECITAAYEAFTAGEAQDFRLHRLDRVGPEVKAVSYDEDSLSYATEMSHEVR